MLGAPTGEVPAADKLVATLKSLHATLESNLTRARSTYKTQADKLRRPHPSLAIGDLVMVKASNFKLHLKSRKLGPRRIGPFKVSKQVNGVAYQIELPAGSKVHPVFHVSQLRKFSGDAPSPVDPINSSTPGEELY